MTQPSFCSPSPVGIIILPNYTVAHVTTLGLRSEGAVPAIVYTDGDSPRVQRSTSAHPPPIAGLTRADSSKQRTRPLCDT
jgi:hypothetical protein